MMMRKNMEEDENEGDKYAAGPYVKPDESSQQFRILYLRICFNIIILVLFPKLYFSLKLI